MLGSWDRWEESQPADPRKALLQSVEQDAKRQRLGEGPPGPHVWGAGLGALPSLGAPVGAGLPMAVGLTMGVAVPLQLQGLPAAPPQIQGPCPGREDDMTAQIVNALQNHIPNAARGAAPQGFAPPAPPAQVEAGEPELGARLLDSLRTLLPTGESAAVCQSSEEGQELFRVVQQRLAPPPPVQPLGGAPPVAQDDLPEVPAVAFPPRMPPPDRPPSPREEDAESSDDGVPHRLPPGFGAIPEDLVEERARQREEERVLRLKATQPCRFGRRCKKRDCPNAHPEGRDIDTALNPCAFGRRCKRKGCFYDHPEGRLIDDDPAKGMCKYGIRCSRPDCLYDHPEGRVPAAGSDPRICYFCHGTGHIASDCPQNPESWNYKREAGMQIVAVPTGK